MREQAPRLINAMSVDVEDYYQVEGFGRYIDRSRWDEFPSRVEQNTDVLLELMSERGIKATFFTLGCVAEKFPAIVRKIVEQGHELASHGYSHEVIYRQSQKKFKQETLRAKAVLEDTGQVEVRGYRAATYSIIRETLWALDTLVEAGFVYDSSIFPIHHDRYGIADINPLPHEIETPAGRRLVEFPVSTLNARLFNLPVAGGGYFRLFPYGFTRWALHQINASGNEFVFYLHPWEIDLHQPRIDNASWTTKFRHYNNIGRCKARLERLIADFRFDTLWSVLVHKKLVEQPEKPT